MPSGFRARTSQRWNSGKLSKKLTRMVSSSFTYSLFENRCNDLESLNPTQTYYIPVLFSYSGGPGICSKANYLFSYFLKVLVNLLERVRTRLSKLTNTFRKCLNTLKQVDQNF